MEYSLGNWVKRRRKSLDLTQQELAQRVGCSHSAIFKIESDERRPSRQIAELLAKHLEIPSEQQELFLKIARREKSTANLGEIPDLIHLERQSIPHIPLLPGPLFGREIEMVEIPRLIQQSGCRLLTLTGQGGIGKTHLAIHTAATLASSNLAQVIFVKLEPVIGREQSITAIADALGIVLYAASDRENQLISYLREKEFFLILDGFEHLTTDAGCLNLINDILRNAHKTKIIVTSRHPLQLQAEWVFEIQGLPLPKSQRPEELASSSAIALFIQRASQASVGYKPVSEDFPAIARICQLVEGLPLGIELAATWIRTLSCDEIAQEIQKSLDFLITTARDLPERHRSMRAAIEHSWQLLTAEEQKCLRQLSIFRGGFSRQAAEAVAQASLPILQALVSKSLIRRTESGRYDMHELIHQFALGRLQEDDSEFIQTQEKHCQYYAELLEQRGPALKGANRPVIVAELISDLANLRQAWHWASSHQQRREISQSADTLFWLYESRSNCREGVPLFGMAIEGLQIGEEKLGGREKWEHQLALGQALGYKGFFLFRQGQHPQGREALLSSLAMLEAIPEQGSREWKMALSNFVIFLGAITSAMGDFAEGERLLQKGLDMKQELSDLWGCAFCLRQISLSAHLRGEYAKSYDAIEQSLLISQELGNSWAIAASLTQIGIVAYSRGMYEQALKYLSDGLEISRSIEDRASIAEALDGLGLVYTAQNLYEEAHDLFKKSIALWDEIGEQGNLAQTLIHAGDALLRMGKIKEAGECFHKSLSVANDALITPILLDALIGNAQIRVAQNEIEYAFDILSAVSRHNSSSHTTRENAEKLLRQLEARLPAEDEKSGQGWRDLRNIDFFVDEILHSTGSSYFPSTYR